MTKIRLEFEKLTINRPKQRWKLYFIVVTEHPTNRDKMVATTVPINSIIRMKPEQNNVLNFKPEGTGTDGLFVIERDMPNDLTLKTRVFLRHSRRSVRNTGDLLGKIKDSLGNEAEDIISNILGTTATPWLVISKTALGLLGSTLEKIRDRKFGFVSMDEEFSDEFKNETELDRFSSFSTGQASIVWSWSTNN